MVLTDGAIFLGGAFFCERVVLRVGQGLHSTRLVKQHGAIFVDNVNAGGLAKTRMAKSVLDAGWSTFRNMLQYKCVQYKSNNAGVWFEEVNEAYSTQDCSACGARSGPKGLKGLGIRGWVCSECVTVHDRDVNAARNILVRGLAHLAEGTPTWSAAGVKESPAFSGRGIVNL